MSKLLELIEHINSISIAVAIIAVCISIVSIFVALKIFRRSSTLQTEIFILNAYKEYVNTAFNDNIDGESKDRARTQFLMAIDLYCKYVNNGHLDSKLSDDNLHFYEEVILMFEDEIKANINEYNNIANYAQKYKIHLV